MRKKNYFLLENIYKSIFALIFNKKNKFLTDYERYNQTPQNFCFRLNVMLKFLENFYIYRKRE